MSVADWPQEKVVEAEVTKGTELFISQGIYIGDLRVYILKSPLRCQKFRGLPKCNLLILKHY